MGGNVFRSIVGISTLGLSEMAYYQPKAQADAQKKATAAQNAADMEARRIAASQKPMEESATLLTDTGDMASTLGTLGLMTQADTTTRKKTTGLGTSTTPIGLGIGG